MDTDPTHPNNQHHKWGNYCLYCKTDNYDPAANHGLRLWHYCVNCVLVCRECGEEKPLFAFAYDKASEAYKIWQAAIKAGGALFKGWQVANATFGKSGHAKKDAHLNLCCHCDNRHRDEQEATNALAATARKQAALKKQLVMLEDPAAKVAIDAMLESLKQ